MSGEPQEKNTEAAPRKSVRFDQIAIREFGVTLGDHPGTGMGPPITLEWDHHTEHVIPLDAYEQAFDEKQQRRRGRELLMPGKLRHEILIANHSDVDIRKAQRQAGRIRSSRSMAVATTDIEPFEIVFQSVVRKFKRWKNRRNGVEPEPADLWVQEFKKLSVKETKNEGSA